MTDAADHNSVQTIPFTIPVALLHDWNTACRRLIVGVYERIVAPVAVMLCVFSFYLPQWVMSLPAQSRSSQLTSLLAQLASHRYILSCVVIVLDFAFRFSRRPARKNITNKTYLRIDPRDGRIVEVIFRIVFIAGMVYLGMLDFVPIPSKERLWPIGLALSLGVGIWIFASLVSAAKFRSVATRADWDAERKLIVDDQFVQFIAPTQEIRLAWSGFSTLVDMPRGFAIVLDKSRGALLVPRAAFTDELEAQRFVQLAATLITQSKVAFPIQSKS